MSTRGATQVTEPTPLRDPFDFQPLKKSVTYNGVTYVFRELTVAENDVCRDGATNEKDQTFDGRLMMRLMIAEASLEPKIDIETLAKFPQRLYAHIVELVSELNDPETLKDEDPGKS